MVDADLFARRLLVLNEALRELERPEAADARTLAQDAVRALRGRQEPWRRKVSTAVLTAL